MEENETMKFFQKRSVSVILAILMVLAGLVIGIEKGRKEAQAPTDAPVSAESYAVPAQYLLDESGTLSADAKERIIQYNADTKRLHQSLVGVLITNGLDGCLFVMSVEEFTLLHKKISEQPLAKVKKLQRYFFGDAAKVKPDKQGRVLLTPSLIKCGNLQRDVVVLGADTRVELWDAATYEGWHDDNTEVLSDEISAIMAEVGI